MLFYNRYTVCDRFADDSEIQTNVSNVVKWPTSFLVELAQTVIIS